MPLTKTVIRIGHGSYSHPNSVRFCFSKAQAVRVLRARGCTRDVARDFINRLAKTGGGNIVYAREPHDDFIEGYLVRPTDGYDLDELYRDWKNAPEV